MMSETENGFRDEFFFLSNFYEAPVTISYQGVDFVLRTGEHLFQGMKIAAAVNPAENLEALAQLEAAPTPGKAKYWGRSIKIDVAKWNSMSLSCMKRTLELKFSQHPELMDKLVATGDIKLVEYNDWNDQLWGVNQTTKVGQNRLGELLMSLRAAHQR